MIEDERSLPLFPLNSVLFPGTILPLHVFEERYKLMIGTCLVTDRTFGVALIKEGEEVGGPAVPFEIGTEARIVEVERLPGGRMNLVAIGGSRFRLRRVVQREPFLVGFVSPLAASAESPDLMLAAQVAERFRAYLLDLRGNETTMPAVELADDAESLSFQVASALRIAAPLRQELLELGSTSERLRRLVAIVRREHDLLRLLSEAGPIRNIGPFSAN